MGYIQIYTGNGKGKTTAAIGLCIRAAGRGKKSFIAQFLKGRDVGEKILINNRLSDLITIKQYGTEEFIDKNNLSKEIIEKTKIGLKEVKQAYKQDYDIIVLEEFNLLYFFNLIKKEEMLWFLENKPKKIELIITGRYAPDFLIKKADLVTEMKEIKHYYTKGVDARLGIEF